MRCGAKTRDGDPCKNSAMPNGRCRMHGGKQVRGIARHNTTHGRYSKDMPTRLAQRYAEAQADPDLLNLNDEINLARVLLMDAMRGIDTGEAGRLWSMLKAEWTTLQAANRDKDADRARETLNEIGRLINRGVADYAARQEVLETADRVRRLVETEGKRRTTMHQMITAERATLLISALVDIVMRRVDDPRTRQLIAADIGELPAFADAPGD